jgi:hypothetical protein
MTENSIFLLDGRISLRGDPERGVFVRTIDGQYGSVNASVGLLLGGLDAVDQKNNIGAKVLDEFKVQIRPYIQLKLRPRRKRRSVEELFQVFWTVDVVETKDGHIVARVDGRESLNEALEEVVANLYDSLRSFGYVVPEAWGSGPLWMIDR